MNFKDQKRNIRNEFLNRVKSIYPSTTKMEIGENGKWWFCVEGIEFEVSFPNNEVICMEDIYHYSQLEMESNLNQILKEVNNLKFK